MDLCTGKPAGLFDVCHNFLPRILTCFKEGTLFLTDAPLRLSAEFRDSQLVVQWSTPLSRSEMVENYLVTMSDLKTGTIHNWTVHRDNHSIAIDPNVVPTSNEIFVQTENFHGFSARSAPFAIDVNEISNNFEHNVQQDASGNIGAAVAIGLSIAGIALVVFVVGGAYLYRRKRDLREHAISMGGKGDDKLKKPVNAFYIPGYFGKRLGAVKTCSDSSYATSFSVRRSASGKSEPVYSDVSGANLWMFGSGDKRNKEGKRKTLSRSSSDNNIYDNHVPAGRD